MNHARRTHEGEAGIEEKNEAFNSKRESGEFDGMSVAIT